MTDSITEKECITDFFNSNAGLNFTKILLTILKDPVTYTDSPDVVGYEVVRAEFGIRLLPDKVVP